jgi:hypothetical protein
MAHLSKEQGSHDRPSVPDEIWLSAIESQWAERAGRLVVPPGEHEERLLRPWELLSGLRGAIVEAAVARDAILRSINFSLLEEVAEAQGQPDGVLQDQRQQGVLLALPDHGDLLVPHFQFHEADITKAVYPGILAVNQFIHGERDAWGIVSWWLQPSRSLGGQVPIEILSDDPHDITRLDQAAYDAVHLTRG